VKDHFRLCWTIQIS